MSWKQEKNKHKEFLTIDMPRKEKFNRFASQRSEGVTKNDDKEIHLSSAGSSRLIQEEEVQVELSQSRNQLFDPLELIVQTEGVTLSSTKSQGNEANNIKSIVHSPKEILSGSVTFKTIVDTAPIAKSSGQIEKILTTIIPVRRAPIQAPVKFEVEKKPAVGRSSALKESEKTLTTIIPVSRKLHRANTITAPSNSSTETIVHKSIEISSGKACHSSAFQGEKTLTKVIPLQKQKHILSLLKSKDSIATEIKVKRSELNPIFAPNSQKSDISVLKTVPDKGTLTKILPAKFKKHSLLIDKTTQEKIEKHNNEFCEIPPITIGHINTIDSPQSSLLEPISSVDTADDMLRVFPRKETYDTAKMTQKEKDRMAKDIEWSRKRKRSMDWETKASKLPPHLVQPIRHERTKEKIIEKQHVKYVEDSSRATRVYEHGKKKEDVEEPKSKSTRHYEHGQKNEVDSRRPIRETVSHSRLSERSNSREKRKDRKRTSRDRDRQKDRDNEKEQERAQDREKKRERKENDIPSFSNSASELSFVSPRSIQSRDGRHKIIPFFTKKYIFSNHFPCPDLIVNEKTFSCTEQYYMWRKAKFFKNEAAASAILMSSDPKQMKLIGSSLDKFDSRSWKEVSWKYMLEANLEKYEQFEQLRFQLFRTIGGVLAEASPTDHYWGIGLAIDDEKISDADRWKGENVLGKMLMEIRDLLADRREYRDEVRRAKRCLIIDSY